MTLGQFVTLVVSGWWRRARQNSSMARSIVSLSVSCHFVLLSIVCFVVSFLSACLFCYKN